MFNRLMVQRMTQISEELIIKFIENRCSDSELQAVRQWIDESDDNARQIFELENTAMLAGSIRADGDTRNRIWDSVTDRIADDLSRRARLRRIKIFRWSAAAAVFVGILLCAIFILRGPGVEMIELTADNGTISVTLPDSTKVWLKQHASISYPASFAADSRNVSIAGEAYFEVARDASRPFTVEGKWLNVTVLGTKFNFNSSDNKQNTVSLVEGKVEVTPNSNKDGVMLSPGQKIEFDPSNGRMAIVNTNTSLDAVWHDNLIHFHNATISEIASNLEKLYHISITIRNTVDNTRTYSGATAYYQTVDSTLEALCETLPLSFTHNESGIVISTKK